jgi:hypothetical protein
MPQWILDLTASSPVIGGIIVGIATVLAVIGWAWKQLKPPTKGIEHFLEDWNGEPARPGVPARPGMMQRVANIESSQVTTATHQTKADAFFEKYGPIIDKLDHEMHPNSGSSLADAVNRTEASLKLHIEACPPPVTTVNVTTGSNAA